MITIQAFVQASCIEIISKLTAILSLRHFTPKVQQLLGDSLSFPIMPQLGFYFTIS